MRIIPTRIHGVFDYLVAPWLLGFAIDGPAQWVPVLLGVAAVIYSLLTRYELGLAPLISMPVHLGLDVASGVLLAASAWLFGSRMSCSGRI